MAWRRIRFSRGSKPSAAAVLWLVAGALSVAVLAAAACGGSDAATPRGPFSVDVEDGTPVGGPQRFDVRRGDVVDLRVRADVSGDALVPGYELSRPVGPDEPTQLIFPADLEGVFDVRFRVGAAEVPVATLTVAP
ncbi:MAG: hypothetical protein R3C15_16535 [Thermoleophilia bacterium]